MNEHSLKPLWIGIICMTLGVGLIYWAFHSGSRTSNGIDGQTGNYEEEFGDGEICVQVVTSAKNPQTGEVVEYPTPCDVPEGWEVVLPEVVE